MKITNKWTCLAATAAVGLLLVASNASANLLTNGSFEEPNAFPGNIAVTGWDLEFQTFAVWADGTADQNGNFGPLAQDGNQIAKNFADGARVEQEVAVVGGLSTTLSTYIMNWQFDALVNNGQALLQLIFKDSGGGSVGDTSLFYGVDDGLTQQPGDNVDQWTQISITELAPATAVSAFARLQFIPDGGGAMYWDSASLTQVPVPAAVWLFGSGLLGLVGVARRRKG